MGATKRVKSTTKDRALSLTFSTGAYESTAFFIRHDPSEQEFLFFGDVEPDSLAETPQTINVWRAAAPKIPEKLSYIYASDGDYF